jgi:hypothetical protein
MQRARYCWRFCVYAVLHRSLKHVRWALAAEGTKW